MGPRLCRGAPPSLPRLGPRAHPGGGPKPSVVCGPAPASGLRFLPLPPPPRPPPGGRSSGCGGGAGRPLPGSRAGPPPLLALGPGLCPLRASCSVALAPAVRVPGLRAGPPLPPARAGPPPGPFWGPPLRPGGAAGAAVPAAPVFPPRPPGPLARVSGGSVVVLVPAYVRGRFPPAGPCCASGGSPLRPPPAAPAGGSGSAMPDGAPPRLRRAPVGLPHPTPLRGAGPCRGGPRPAFSARFTFRKLSTMVPARRPGDHNRPVKASILRSGVQIL